jgi:hypothetical protein
VALGRGSAAIKMARAHAADARVPALL